MLKLLFFGVLSVMLISNSYGQFIKNEGQVIDHNQDLHPEVAFHNSGGSASVFFESDKVVYNFKKMDDFDFNREPYLSNKDLRDSVFQTLGITFHRVDLEFIGANKDVEIVAKNEKFHNTNYFLNKRENIRNVKSYGKIIYQDLYPNIDLVFHQNKKGIKYDFVLKEGADISNIQLKYEGAKSVKINKKGQLIIETELEKLTEEIPFSFINNDENQEVEVNYKLSEDLVLSYVTKNNTFSELTVDPFLTWGTYYEGASASGGLDYDRTTADENGNFFVAAWANNSANDYPVVDPGGSAYTQAYVSNNLHISKFNADRELVWATYYGGSTVIDWALGSEAMVAVDGELHFVGNQLSDDAPLLNGGGLYQNSPTNRPYYLRFDIASSDLLHATYIGGSSGGDPSIAVSQTGHIAISQSAYNFSNVNIVNRAGAFNQATNGGSKDFYIMLLDPGFNQIWGTFMGGPNTTENFHITFDDNENIFFVGESNDAFSPTEAEQSLTNYPGSYYENTYAGGQNDLLIGKFDANGALVWNTLYGGNGRDGLKSSMGNGSKVIVEPISNDLVVLGGTNSDNFPLQTMTGAYNKTAPANTDPSSSNLDDFNSFILKFDNNGARQWSTYWGDDNDGDLLYNGEFTDCNKFIVSSRTGGQVTMPLTYGYNQASGGQAFLMQFDSDFSAEWSSYIGDGGTPRMTYSIFDNRISLGIRTYGTSFTTEDPGNGAYYDPTKSGGSSTYSIFELNLSPQVTGEDTLCVGDTTTMSAVGTPAGTDPWVSSNTSVATIDNTGFLTAISDGVTTITYTDDAGCTTLKEVVIEPVPTVDAGSDLFVCNNASVTLTATNPDGATISWDNGVNDGVAFTPPTSSTTTYTVTADLSGCSAKDSLEVTTSPTPSFTLSSNDPTTCSGTDGSIVLSGLDPNTSYDISYNSSAPSSMTSDGSGEIVIGGLSEGAYTDFIVDYNGCTETDNTIIDLNDPTPPTVDAGTNQTICDGAPVTLTASNPDGASISWDNGVSDGVAFNPSTTTIYTVTATLTGCTSTDQVTVTVDPTPAVDAGADTIICGSNQVTLTADNPDGASISWDNGVGDGVAFTPPPGTTTYTVTADLGSCSNTDQVDVTANPNPTFTLSSSDPTSCGANDGEIIISGLDPNTNHDVSYNGGAATTYTSDGAGEIIITGLNAGTYDDFEVELNGCATLDPTIIELEDPNSPTVDAGTDQTVCDGDQVTLTADNPDGATISWDNGVVDGDPFTPGVGTTTYTVTADLLGCTSTDQVDVTVTEYPTFTVSTQDVTSCGSADGELIISGLDSNTNYDITYNGTGPSLFTSDASGDIFIDGLTADDYNGIDVTSNGCTTSDNSTFTINDFIDIPSLSAGEITCNESDGTYDVTFFTDNLATVSSTDGIVGNNEITGIPLGNNITITASYGGDCETSITVQGPTECEDDCEFPDLVVSQGICESNTTYSVVFSESTGANITINDGTQNGNIIADIPIGTDLIITATNGGCVTAVTVTSPEDCSEPCENPAYGLAGPICTDSINEFAALNFVLATDATITSSQGTIVGESIIDIPTNTAVTIVISQPGCDNDTVFFDGIDCSECNIDSISVLPNEIAACFGDEIAFSVDNSNANYTYSWYLENDLINTGTDYSFELSNDDQIGSYVVVAELGDPSCQSSDSVLLILDKCDIIVSEALTPNGDGYNDVLYVENLESYPNTKISVFNRWGSKVFESDDYQNNWDGTSESSMNVGGDELPEGSYYYLITLGGDESDENFGDIIKGYFYIKRQ
ncbi:MAG: gliding motility-associated C-terminal domain-containing protein [Brumimicrobium sp.]